MAEIKATKKKVKGPLKWFFKAPVYLYRWNLGFLLGKRFIYFTHIGHKSGKIRASVVEVIEYDAAKDVYYAVAAYGGKAHWLQNIRKQKEVQAQVGGRKFDGVCTELSVDQGFEMLSAYSKKHPALFKQLMSLVGYKLEGTEDEFRQLAVLMPIVTFEAN